MTRTFWSFGVKHKPGQIDLLQTEFIKAKERQDFGSPKKVKVRFTWASRVVASDCIKEGGQFTIQHDSACCSQTLWYKPVQSSSNPVSADKRKVRSIFPPAQPGRFLSFETTVEVADEWVWYLEMIISEQFDLLYHYFLFDPKQNQGCSKYGDGHNTSRSAKLFVQGCSAKEFCDRTSCPQSSWPICGVLRTATLVRTPRRPRLKDFVQAKRTSGYQLYRLAGKDGGLCILF